MGASPAARPRPIPRKIAVIYQQDWVQAHLESFKSPEARSFVEQRWCPEEAYYATARRLFIKFNFNPRIYSDYNPNSYYSHLNQHFIR